MTFVESTVMPLEAALRNYDEVVYLLAALGADINVFPRSSVWYIGKDLRITPLDFVRAVNTTKRIPHTEPNSADSASNPQPFEDAIPAWKAQFEKIGLKHAGLEKERLAGDPQPFEPHFDEVHDYMARVEELLVAHGGKSAHELAPEDDVSEEDRIKAARERLEGYRGRPHTQTYGMTYPYKFHRHGHNEGQGMLAELASQYEELFAACWAGDNAKVQRLCLPSSGPKKELLQISCHWGDRWAGKFRV